MSFGPPGTKARIWFGLHATGAADAPGSAESGSVPNLIRATRDSRPVASRELREPDSGVPTAQPRHKRAFF
jgi:hypothetical protein